MTLTSANFILNAMKDRTREILEVAVRDFIKAGKPITSEYLYELHDFGIKPAMIRWELNGLSEDGFFYQTHPSGGRFPTDKAYRFFVDEVLKDINEDEEWAREHFPKRDTRSLVHELADYMNVLGVGYDIGANEVYGTGLKHLLAHLETSVKDELMDVVNDFEKLEERIRAHREWWEEDELWPKVFIGESPVTRSEHLSVIVGKYQCDDGEVLLFTIGPKRMDYRKSLHLFRSLHDEGPKRANDTKKRS